MPIRHKFENYVFGQHFYTQNAILHTPFDPQVIFVGTFNHGWPWNNADFFYGRGMYMWPILANLFLHKNKDELIGRRNNNENPIGDDILETCRRGRITFADIVLGTVNGIPVVINDQRNSIRVNNEYQWSGYSDKCLNIMGRKGWLEDNVDNIVEYINHRRSIKHVYFTFKSCSWLVGKMNSIANGIALTPEPIFTPTGNGFRKNLSDPYNTRLKSLLHCWVWNGRDHNIKVNKAGYGSLNHNWLQEHAVDPSNF